MRKIFDHENKEKLLAIHHSASDWANGLSFLSSPDNSLQVGTWHYPANKVLRSHIHKTYERKIESTQEAVFVVNGSMAVEIYGLSKVKIEEFILKAGDLLILLAGGHGYKILQDETKVLEFKNGPFLSAEIDKELLA